MIECEFIAHLQVRKIGESFPMLKENKNRRPGRRHRTYRSTEKSFYVKDIRTRGPQAEVLHLFPSQNIKIASEVVVTIKVFTGESVKLNIRAYAPRKFFILYTVVVLG